MRGTIAKGLLAASEVFVVVMAVLSGLGATIAIVVLAATGEISIGAAIAIFFVGLPIVEGIVYLIAMGGAMAMAYTAKLISRETASEWLDEQKMLDY